MSYTTHIAYETLRSIDSSTFTGSYQAVGTALMHAASIVTIVNNSTKDVTISIDGINDYDFVQSTTTRSYNITSNCPPGDVPGVFIPANTQYYVKGASGTGLIYIVVQYIVTG